MLRPRASLLRSTSAALLAFATLVAGAHDAAAQRARCWFGVHLEPAPGGQSGARVSHVVKGSPAERAGVRDGDLLVRLDGEAVASPDHFVKRIAAHAPGEAVAVVVGRGGQERGVKATLAAMPPPEGILRMEKVGAPAPGWSGLATVAGSVPSMSELRGKVVLVDFWASWCSACRMAAPRLSEWQARYGAQGLAVVGVADDDPKLASQAVPSFGIRYAAASDPSAATQRAWGVTALPTLFVVDKAGVVRDVVVGFDPSREPQVEALVKKLLSEPATGAAPRR